jgi:hypothetical protein
VVRAVGIEPTLLAEPDCEACAGKPGYSHITQDEMRSIMKNAVNHVYRLLCLKRHDEQEYNRQIE